MNSIGSYPSYSYVSSLNNESSKTKNVNENTSSGNALNQGNSISNRANDISNQTNAVSSQSNNISNQSNAILSRASNHTKDNVLSSKQTNNHISLSNQSNNTPPSTQTKDTNNISKSKTLNSNSVNDASQAVDKVLGYGVNKEGFFTSDLNEAAGLPKDYRIYAKGMESFVKFQESDFWFSTRYRVDLAKTLGNAYKVFSQLIPQTPNAAFSKEELENLAYAFTMDKNYNVTKIYQSRDDYHKSPELTPNRVYISFNVLSERGFEDISVDNIFSKNGSVELNKRAYINDDGSVNKGGVLMAFLNSQSFGATDALLEGESKLLGKITFDKSISEAERREFLNFMNINRVESAFLSGGDPYLEWDIFHERLSMQLYIKRSQNIANLELTRQASSLAKEYEEMINSGISLDEFKEKYLDFKQRYDDFLAKLKREEKVQGIDFSKGISSPVNNHQTREKEESKRKPIQAKSQSKTYENKNMNEALKKLLENEFDEKQKLEILLGIKSSGDVKDSDFRRILLQMNSNNVGAKSVDVRV